MAKPSFHVEELYRFHSPTWYLRSQFSILYSRNQGGYSLSVSGGYQFNHWLAVGVGSGIDNYYATQGFNMFPAYAEARIGMYKKIKPLILEFVQDMVLSLPMRNWVRHMHVVGGFSILFLVIALAQVIHIWTFMPVSGFQSAYYESLGNQSRSEMTIDFRRYDIGFGITF
ncbi:MAG: hypothetical protein IPJ13_07065 [Saprospiraceae bacterium]|nr:hypothetical protein [Saprospiraceae bacterium]